MRRGNTYTVRCRRCRHRWEEIGDSRVTQGIGHLLFCPRCLSRSLERKKD